MQGGLPGFLVVYHTDILTSIYELQDKNKLQYLQISEAITLPGIGFLGESNVNREPLLRQIYPMVFIDALETMGRFPEIKEC